MRILFMGTPEFALFSLSALVDSGEDVVGVVTRIDKPKGRGKALTPPPVKVYAESHGIPVYQPKTLRDEAFASLLREIDPDLIVVVAFGMLLPENVLSYPKYGCLNVHGSLLPEYRGAAPMQRVLIDGRAETGVTIMYMDAGIDTGDMLLTRRLPLSPEANFETVHDGLGRIGAGALLESIALLRAGSAPRIPQDHERATYAAKITKEDCLLDFGLPAETLHNTIRGLSPFPLAFFHIADGKLLKVTRSAVQSTEPSGKAPGTVLSLQGGGVSVACGEGSLLLLSVVPEGKKPMDALSFARGRGWRVGDVIKQ